MTVELSLTITIITFPNQEVIPLTEDAHSRYVDQHLMDSSALIFFTFALKRVKKKKRYVLCGISGFTMETRYRGTNSGPRCPLLDLEAKSLGKGNHKV